MPSATRNTKTNSGNELSVDLDAERPVEDQRAEPERRAEGQHHRRDEDQRRDDRPQQHGRARAAPRSMISGMITRLSRCEAVWTSRLRAVLPPTSASPSPTSSSADAQLARRCRRRPRCRRRRRASASISASSPIDLRLRDRRDAVGRRPRRGHVVRRVGAGQDVDRVARRRRGSARPPPPRPTIDSGVPRNESACGQALGVQAEQAEAGHQQQPRPVTEPDRPGARLDRARRRGPTARSRSARRCPASGAPARTPSGRR